jgi:hypothetical protein
LVQLEVGDPASERDGDLALAALLEALEDVVVDRADSRRVVVLAGLEHRARRRDGVAASLDLDRVEEGPVGDVIVGIQLGLEEVARLEVDEPVRARPHRRGCSAPARRAPRLEGAIVRNPVGQYGVGR